MNGTLVLNSTVESFPLWPESLAESIKESIWNWRNQSEIFEVLKRPSQRTEEKRREPMNETFTFIDDSVEENRLYSSYFQIIHQKHIAEEFPKASQRIQMFEGFKENWDGDQGLPPSRETIDHAYEILYNLCEVARVRRTRAPEPRVTCSGDGSITFAWTLSKTELELGFWLDKGHPRYDYFVCLTSDEVSCDEGVFEGDLVNSPTFVALFSGL